MVKKVIFLAKHYFFLHILVKILKIKALMKKMRKSLLDIYFKIIFTQF